MSKFNGELEKWVKDLDHYRKKYNLTREEAVLVLEDKDRLADKLQNWKKFNQFIEIVKILNTCKTDKITGFAG